MLLCMLGFQKKKVIRVNKKSIAKCSDQNYEVIYQIESLSEQVENAGSGEQSLFHCNEPNPEYTQRRVKQDGSFMIIPKEIGMEQDSVALGFIIFEFFARQDGESSEAWKNSANQAIAEGIDGVLNLMHRLPGNASVQQPVAIRRFAALIYDLLKQNCKAGILESLCSKALTLHVLSPDHELSVHDGSGVVMKGRTLREILNGDTLIRDDDCGKLASIQYTMTPRVILKREIDFGIGVQIDEDLGKGKLAGFYAGGFHESMSDQKPTRMCARQSAKQYCDGGDEKLAYEWFFWKQCDRAVNECCNKRGKLLS